jgi:hypothetical protein
MMKRNKLFGYFVLFEEFSFSRKLTQLQQKATEVVLWQRENVQDSSE